MGSDHAMAWGRRGCLEKAAFRAIECSKSPGNWYQDFKESPTSMARSLLLGTCGHPAAGMEDWSVAKPPGAGVGSTACRPSASSSASVRYSVLTLSSSGLGDTAARCLLKDRLVQEAEQGLDSDRPGFNPAFAAH